ncbi:MAG: membrane dipeptidase [Deltaproteobacteria bacterium]|nr:membrane dipeptidase [Deltaproteobacteria bacterium]
MLAKHSDCTGTQQSALKRLPIIDLHCDLLSCLYNHPECTPFLPEARCALPQLQAGGVRLQICAIFHLTEPGSGRAGIGQAETFQRLLSEQSATVHAWRPGQAINGDDRRIQLACAIENASVLGEESEPLDIVLARLDRIRMLAGPLVYLSLTWRDANRFGGGDATSSGLTAEGRVLLDYLAQYGIAVDFAHTSESLAHDICNYRAAHAPTLRLLASHTCFRAVHDIPRNLSDETLRAIIAADGVIGMHWIRDHVGGNSAAQFARHAAQLLQLGGERHLACGADFFYEGDLPPAMRSTEPHAHFYPGFENATHYPNLFALLRRELRLSEAVCEQIAWRNAARFLGAAA